MGRTLWTFSTDTVFYENDPLFSAQSLVQTGNYNGDLLRKWEIVAVYPKTRSRRGLYSHSFKRGTNCLYEEATFESLHGTNEVWSATGETAENRTIGFSILRGTTYVWHSKIAHECDIKIVYNGFAILVRFEPETNLTGRIQDTALQADFIFIIQQVTLFNGHKLWPVENEPYLFIFIKKRQI